MPTPNESWDETYPTGNEYGSIIDDVFRQVKRQFRQLFSKDHEMESDGQGEEWGFHKVVRLLNQNEDPSTITDIGQIYQKTVAGYEELFYRDGQGSRIRLTDKGNVVSGAYYDDKTVNVTNESNIVTGNDTNFVDNVSINDQFIVDGTTTFYRIVSVDSDTQITIDRDYEDSTDNSTDYIIWKNTPRYVEQAGKLSAPLDANNQRIINLGAPEEDNDVLRRPIGVDDIADSVITEDKLDNVSYFLFDTGMYTGDGTSQQSVVVDFPFSEADKWYLRIVSVGNLAVRHVGKGELTHESPTKTVITYVDVGWGGGEYVKFETGWISVNNDVNDEFKVTDKQFIKSNGSFNKLDAEFIYVIIGIK